MDFDDDGYLDMISGSYDPGDVYLFKGHGEGKFDAGITIKDETDTPMVHHPVEFKKYQSLKSASKGRSDEATTARVSSFGSWPSMVDWDKDGDLDMLIGSFGGHLFLRINNGTRKNPSFSADCSQVKAHDKPLKEACHASPVVADWDNDGLWDLVIGSGDGSVGWYRNEGKLGSPRFGSRTVLIQPALVRSTGKPGESGMNKFLSQELGPDELPIQGARAQICVHDYNRDGHLDLIVGDHSDIHRTKELSADESKRFQRVQEDLKEFGKKLKPLQLKLYGPDKDEDNEEALQADYDKLVQQLMKLDKEAKSFYAESGSSSFIWLYLRQPKDDATFTSANGNE